MVCGTVDLCCGVAKEESGDEVGSVFLLLE